MLQLIRAAIVGATFATGAIAAPTHFSFSHSQAGLGLEDGRIYFLHVICDFGGARQLSAQQFLDRVDLGGTPRRNATGYLQMFGIEGLSPRDTATPVTEVTESNGFTPRAAKSMLPIFYASETGEKYFDGPTGFCGQRGYVRYRDAYGAPTVHSAVIAVHDADLDPVVSRLRAIAGPLAQVIVDGVLTSLNVPPVVSGIGDDVGSIVTDLVTAFGPQGGQPTESRRLFVGQTDIETDAGTIHVYLLDRDYTLSGTILNEQNGGADASFLTGLVPFTDTWRAFIKDEEIVAIQEAAVDRDLARCSEVLDGVQSRNLLVDMDVGFIGLVSLRPVAGQVPALSARDCLGRARACASREFSTPAPGEADFLELTRVLVDERHRFGPELDAYCESGSELGWLRQRDARTQSLIPAHSALLRSWTSLAAVRQLEQPRTQILLGLDAAETPSTEVAASAIFLTGPGHTDPDETADYAAWREDQVAQLLDVTQGWTFNDGNFERSLSQAELASLLVVAGFRSFACTLRFSEAAGLASSELDLAALFGADGSPEPGTGRLPADFVSLALRGDGAATVLHVSFSETEPNRLARVGLDALPLAPDAVARAAQALGQTTDCPAELAQ